jgi:hypothetical protein
MFLAHVLMPVRPYVPLTVKQNICIYTICLL